MQIKCLLFLMVLCFSGFISFGQDQDKNEEKSKSTNSEPHRYGGWYCPDNLNGFPAVDIDEWNSVPVVNGRMATQEETRSGASLIFVDMEKYPNARPLDMQMPKLSTYKSRYTGREEIIIVIQAINVDNDSIVGFRYLNGGNGSARLNEVHFLSENEIGIIPKAHFVSHSIQIKATQDKIRKILTSSNYSASLQSTFDPSKKLDTNWRESTNVNWHYPNAGHATSLFADIHFGNFYVQNDYDRLLYNEKFLLLENSETGYTELKISCGPFWGGFHNSRKDPGELGQKGERIK